MDLKAIYSFLNELSINNNREWFHAHKADYVYAQDQFEAFLSVIIADIALFDPSVRHLKPKDCTYRIYRDVRFSKDKSPYKTHIGGFICAKGKKSIRAGYYVHIENNNSLLGGGSWGLESPVLKDVRESIYHNIEEFIGIVESKSFNRYFPKLGMEGDSPLYKLKNAPKGFPKEFEHVDYLKHKEYTCICPVSTPFDESPQTFSFIAGAFKELKRYNDFLNHTIDDHI